ncbi:MAG: hypothetical protein K0Q94_1436 [Paenibacillus sp.]|jgi:hypothetical protein|uniref:hypothetical protein n=1 Tax=Paenibacillus sp. GCM10012303 TaxID=3317340 RepID=UPI0029F171DB|nr:hypothetical protein [Paenibacillus sp.]
MLLRSFVICGYLAAAYWISAHYPIFKMVFYPTLGAFSYLFMQRMDQMKDIRRIIIGACISTGIGAVFYTISSGALSLLATALVTVLLIQWCKWNAAPILAVSLIPYFVRPEVVWVLPLTVLASLLCLLLPLWLIGKLELLLRKAAQARLAAAPLRAAAKQDV